MANKKVIKDVTWSGPFFAAARRMLKSTGKSRRADEIRAGTIHPGYYSMRIAKGLDDPASVGAHLRRALALWSEFPGRGCNPDGSPAPSVCDWMARGMRAMMDAIDDDDEADAQTPENKATPDILRQLVEVLDKNSASVVGKLEPYCLSIENAARFLGVERKTIKNLIRTRQLEHVQVGSQRTKVATVEGLKTLAKKRTIVTGEDRLERRNCRQRP
jgi:excisionase family DNA binding protein